MGRARVIVRDEGAKFKHLMQFSLCCSLLLYKKQYCRELSKHLKKINLEYAVFVTAVNDRIINSPSVSNKSLLVICVAPM